MPRVGFVSGYPHPTDHTCVWFRRHGAAYHLDRARFVSLFELFWTLLNNFVLNSNGRLDSTIRPTWRTVDQWFAASVVSTYRSLSHGRLLFSVVLVIIIDTVVIIVAADRERFCVRCRGQSMDKAEMCLLCICGYTRGGRQRKTKRSTKLSPVCPSVLHHSRLRGVECRFCDMLWLWYEILGTLDGTF